MNTASNNVIESKAVLLSILRDNENEVVESAAMKANEGLSVSLVRLSTGDWAVCDKSFDGNYMTYLFESFEENAARHCYDHTVEQIKDSEAIDEEQGADLAIA